MNERFLSVRFALSVIVMPVLPAYAYADIEKHCELYADKAVEQQQRNLDAQCNLSGARWSSDREGQYQWCLTVRPEITNKENQEREKMLQACLQRKAEQRVAAARSLGPADEDALGIATACLDPEGEFSPVEYLYSKKTGYQKEPALYKPILSRNGVIKHDFNADREPDYVFIEKSKTGKVRLTSCVSDSESGGYTRTPSAWWMHEYKEGEDISNYEISLSYDKLTVAETTFRLPAGAESKISVYSFDKALGSFVMEARNTLKFSADGATGTVSGQYDLVNKTWRESLDCNNVPAEFHSLCKPHQRSGRLILADRLPRLEDAGPVLYRKKVSD